jgi:hypothetical protein
LKSESKSLLLKLSPEKNNHEFNIINDNYIINNENAQNILNIKDNEDNNIKLSELKPDKEEIFLINKKYINDMNNNEEEK